MKPIALRWLAVIIMPIALIAWFTLAPANNPTDYLINGIILSCAAVFLFKYILVTAIMAHLRQDIATKKHALFQLIPIVCFIAYIVAYFLQ